MTFISLCLPRRQNVRHGNAGVRSAALGRRGVGALHHGLKSGAMEVQDVGERQAHSNQDHIPFRDVLRGNHQTEDFIYHLRVRRVHLRVHAAVPRARPRLDGLGHHLRRPPAGAGVVAGHLDHLREGL